MWQCDVGREGCRAYMIGRGEYDYGQGGREYGTQQVREEVGDV